MATLLLIDDNELNLDMLSRRLRLRGHRVVCAPNGSQGIAVAGRERPDMILMDLSMPHMDGWEATRILKASPLTKSIPVVAVTSHAMKEDEARAEAAGFAGFISKPIEFDRLEALIARLLSRSATA